MTFRIYLRDAHQRVTEKTVTGDPAAALSAFSSLVGRVELDGQMLLAVLNRDGRPVAHHDFRMRPDGSPIDPSKHWRGRIDEIALDRVA